MKNSIYNVFNLYGKFFNFSRRLIFRLVLHRLPGNSKSWGPPRFFRYNANDFPQPCNLKTLDGYKEESIIRIPPINVSSFSPKVFTTALSESIKSYSTNIFYHGRVFGSLPLIIDSNDTVIGDLSFQFAPFHHQIYKRWKLPPLVTIGSPALVLSGGSGYNYFHWLQQMLPRLIIAERSGFNRDDFAVFIVNDGPKFIKESLSLLGISDTKIQATSHDLHISSEQLIVPEAPLAGNPSPWIANFYLDYADKISRSHALSYVPRIFVSRAKSSSRRIINEEAIYSVLAEYGFERVYTEDLSFVQQISIFHNAEVVCGPHGAGLANAFFCRPGTKLIEIFHPQHPNICYWTIASICKLDYYLFVGEGNQVDIADYSKPHLNHLDINCSLSKLRTLLDLLGL